MAPVLPSLGRWRAGNTGIAGVWTFAADTPGPHVMVNALTHGNEPCGAVAVLRLLEAGVRPVRGRLTLSFANIAAYDAFRAGTARPGRFLDRDLNRLWSDAMIDADDASREAARARQLRPAVAAADVLLDLHSTAHVARPFFVIADLGKTRALADRMAMPPTQQLMPGGCAEGRHLIDYGRFSDPDDPAVAVTVECGRHDDPSAGDVAAGVTARFLVATGTVAGAPSPPGAPIERYRTVSPYTVASDDFRFLGRTDGFHAAAAGETVALDGDNPVRAPFDTVIVSPRPAPRRGEAAFLWSVRAD